MNNAVQNIELLHLSLAFIPVAFVLIILWRWSLGAGHASYALSRMLGQLLIIGYFLAFIFESDSAWIVLMILAVMVFASGWIALGSVAAQRRQLMPVALLAIAIGGGFTLLLSAVGVLQLQPWYLPQFVIPLGGMVFANAMNTISIGAERLRAELGRGIDYASARNNAFHAGMIPTINSLFAVGLVTLPGMMTGQILAGVSPLIAARYQIMIMCMIFGASGIAMALFLLLSRRIFETTATKSQY